MGFVKSQFALPSVTRRDGTLGDYVKTGFQFPTVTRPDGTLGAYVAFDANPVGDQYLFPAQRLAILAARQKAAAAVAAKNKGWFGLGDTSCTIDPVTGGRVCSSNFVPAAAAPPPQACNCPPPVPCPPCAPCPVGNPRQIDAAPPVFLGPPVSASAGPAVTTVPTVSANSNVVTPSLFRFYQRLAVNPLQRRQLVLQGIAHAHSQKSRAHLRGLGLQPFNTDTKTPGGFVASGPFGPPDTDVTNGVDAATFNAITDPKIAVAALALNQSLNQQQAVKKQNGTPGQTANSSLPPWALYTGGGIIALSLVAAAVKGGSKRR